MASEGLTAGWRLDGHQLHGHERGEDHKARPFDAAMHSEWKDI